MMYKHYFGIARNMIQITTYMHTTYDCIEIKILLIWIVCMGYVIRNINEDIHLE